MLKKNENNELAVIKTSLDELVLAEIYKKDDKAFILVNPFILIMESDHSSGLPFLFGTDQTSFEVDRSYVIAFAPADKFMSRFYGSLMWKMEYKNFAHEIQDQQFDSQEAFDNHIENVLSSIKTQIINKFGMLEGAASSDEDEDSPVQDITDRVLH